MADKKVTEQYYAPPPKLSNWEGFKRFLWNGETGQFMGRTAGSWGELHKFFFFYFRCWGYDNSNSNADTRKKSKKSKRSKTKAPRETYAVW